MEGFYMTLDCSHFCLVDSPVFQNILLTQVSISSLKQSSIKNLKSKSKYLKIYDISRISEEYYLSDKSCQLRCNKL